MQTIQFEKFLSAQNGSWSKICMELNTGRKTGHWMWFIFPQLKGLGISYNAQLYAIENLIQAREYLEHPVLSRRLQIACELLLKLTITDPVYIFGNIDAVKLRSSMTLFSTAQPAEQRFKKVLCKFYDCKPDQLTLDLLGG